MQNDIEKTLNLINFEAIYGNGKTQLKIATGSPGELGLLQILSESFCEKNDVQICWIKAGSGEGLALLKNKQIDIAMVHAPSSEIQAIKDGWAEQRTLIGSNEFYIIGDKNDPACVKKAKNVVEAYTRVYDSKSLFYTRADNSGTHKKELSIWEMAKLQPKGSWYVTNKDFMLATLMKADETCGYFMSDSSTWVVAKKYIKNSEILFSGDLCLINTYSALKQNGLETLEKQKAKEFIEFVASEDGQDIIRNFGKKEHGEAIYNDFLYAKKYFIK